jgi:hypothetical protein
MSILNRINIFMMDGNLIKIKCVCGGSELIAQALKDNKYRLSVPCILCPTAHSFTLSSGAFFQKDLFAFSCKFTAINICYIGSSNNVFEAMKKNEEELMKTFAAYEDEYGEEYDDDLDYFGDPGDFDGDGDLFDLFDYDPNDPNDPDDPNNFLGSPGSPGDLDLLRELLKEKEPEPPAEPGFTLHKNSGFVPPETDAAETAAGQDAAVSPDNGARIPIQLRSYQITGQILDSVSRLCEDNSIYCRCSNFDGKIVLAGNAVHIECKNCGSYRDIRSANSADADYLSDAEELYLDFDE